MHTGPARTMMLLTQINSALKCHSLSHLLRMRMCRIGWKIAYQIEPIRLNCSHKYCFFPCTPAMIALVSNVTLRHVTIYPHRVLSFFTSSSVIAYARRLFRWKKRPTTQRKNKANDTLKFTLEWCVRHAIKNTTLMTQPSSCLSFLQEKK